MYDFIKYNFKGPFNPKNFFWPIKKVPIDNI